MVKVLHAPTTLRIHTQAVQIVVTSIRRCQPTEKFIDTDRKGATPIETVHCSHPTGLDALKREKLQHEDCWINLHSQQPNIEQGKTMSKGSLDDIKLCKFEGIKPWFHGHSVSLKCRQKGTEFNFHYPIARRNQFSNNQIPVTNYPTKISRNKIMVPLYTNKFSK